MSLGTLTLKISLVATVTGASIATPILLNRSSVISSVTSLGSETERTKDQVTLPESNAPRTQETENSVARGGDSKVVGNVGSKEDSSSPRSPVLEEQQRENQAIGSSDPVRPTNADSEPTESLSRNGKGVVGVDSGKESDGQVAQGKRDVLRSGISRNDLTSSSSSISEVTQPLTTKVENFDKKCFIVPAEFNDGENIELLTCYNKQDIIRKDIEESNAEYSSLFHIYDRNKPDNPLKIDGSLMWNPENQKIVASITETLENKEYSFTAKDSRWSKVSSETKNLIGENECAIYKVSPAVESSSFLLTCGNYFLNYDPAEPEGIPLIVWEKRN